jgi:branched-chain amino acid transport system ATP-binding protein
VTYGKVTALRELSFSLDQGDFAAMIGPNGAGKSTLADALSGFVDYDGQVRYLDKEVRDYMTASSLDILRQSGRSLGDRLGTIGNRLVSRGAHTMVNDGMIYCTETRNLFGNLSVERNLNLGTYQRKGNVAERREFVYDLFPVLDERSDQLSKTLSGGEQQMLAIGRALMSNPRMLILDEPTLGLSPVVCEDIADALSQIHNDGVTILLCEQNVTFAMDLAEDIYLMENGEFAREGTAETLRGDDYIQNVYLGQ